MSISSFVDTSIGPKFLSISNTDLQTAFGTAIREADVGQIAPILNVNKSQIGLMVGAKLLDLSFTHEDSIYVPTIWARNRNDGTQALSTGLGLFRFICLNGLYFGVSVFAGRLIHRAGETAEEFLSQLPNMIQDGIYQIQSGALQDTITEASDLKVADPIDIVASLPQLTERQKAATIARLSLDDLRVGDRSSDAWGLYNIVNEVIRQRSRSALASANRDIGLLDDITALTLDQHQRRAA